MQGIASQLPPPPAVQDFLSQLDSKFSQISRIKDQLSLALRNHQYPPASHGSDPSDRRTIAQYMRECLSPSIANRLQEYHRGNLKDFQKMCSTYEWEISKRREFYQEEIHDLRDEIRRQYKVIGLMKQEVEDLMVLIKEQRLEEGYEVAHCQGRESSGQASPQGSGRSRWSEKQGEESPSEQRRECQPQGRPSSGMSSTSRNRRFSFDLDIIEEETERTLLSSERSAQKNNQEQSPSPKPECQEPQHCGSEGSLSKGPDSNQSLFIRIEQEQEQNPLQKLQEDCRRGKGEQKRQSEEFLEEDLSSSRNSEIDPKFESIAQREMPLEKRGKRILEFKDDQPSSNTNHIKRTQAPLPPAHLQSIFFPDEEDPAQSSKNPHSQMQMHSIESIKKEGSTPHEISMNNSVTEHTLEDNHSAIEGSNNTQVASQLHFYSEQSFTRTHTHIQNQFFTEESEDAEPHGVVESHGVVEPHGVVESHGVRESENNLSKKRKRETGGLREVKLVDTTNCEPESRNGNKPKTKQFLQQFRKTFNKCLNSMQVSKKNSGKQMGRGNQLICTSNPAFGKVQTPEPRSQKERDIANHPNQQKLGQHLRAVDMMFKELQNSNKFTVGSKKLELKYEGERRSTTRHGNGMLFYSNGLCYEGEFRDGVRHGYGILKFNHIQIYNGDWAEDEMEGQGKIRNCAIINKKKTVHSGQSALGKWISYSGELKGSRFEGCGTLYLQGGEKFVGQFSGGVASGEGAIYRKNGEVEEGTWKNNVLLRNGEVEEGTWKNNVLLRNGEVEEGTWKNNVLLRNGEVEEGTWKSNVLQKQPHPTP